MARDASSQSSCCVAISEFLIQPMLPVLDVQHLITHSSLWHTFSTSSSVSRSTSSPRGRTAAVPAPPFFPAAATAFLPPVAAAPPAAAAGLAAVAAAAAGAAAGPLSAATGVPKSAYRFRSGGLSLSIGGSASRSTQAGSRSLRLQGQREAGLEARGVTQAYY